MAAVMDVTENERPRANSVQAKNVCLTPLKIVGVQDKTPLAWDNDGNWLLFASNNRSLYLWKLLVSEGKALDQTPYRMSLTKMLSGGHKHKISCATFHPEFASNNQIVTGGADGIIIWNATDGTITRHIEVGKDIGRSFHESDIEVLKFIYGGAFLVSGSKDSAVKVWDAQNDFALVDTLNGHKAPVLTIDFHLEKNLLATAGRDSSVKIWDVSTLEPSRRLARQDDRGENVQLRCSMDGHRGDVCALTFFPSGNNVLSGARDNTMKIWSVDTAREEREVKGNVHSADVRKIVFLPQGKHDQATQHFLSCGLDGLIKVWKTGSVDAVAGIMSAEDMEIGAKQTLADILSDNAVVDILAVDVVADAVVAQVQAHANDVWAMEKSVRVLSDGSFIVVTASVYNEVRFWCLRQDPSNPDVFSIQLVQEYVGHRDELTSCQLIKNDRYLVTSSEDYSVHLYDLETMECKRQFDFGGAALRLAVDEDHKYVMVGGTDYVIKMYELDPPYAHVANYRGHSGRVISLSVKKFGGKNYLVSGGHDFNLLLWELKGRGPNTQIDSVAEYEPIKKILAHEGHVMDLQFARGDLTKLASGGNDHTVKCWELKKGPSLVSCWENSTSHHSVVTSVCWGAYDSANMIFSTGWDSIIYAWDSRSKTGTHAGALAAHEGRVTEVEVSPNGLHLYSCGADLKTYVWKTTAPFDCLCQYRTSVSMGVISTLSVGVNVCCTGDGDGLIRIWPAFRNEKYKGHFSAYHDRRASFMMVGDEEDEMANGAMDKK